MDAETFASLKLARERYTEARAAYEQHVRILLTPGTPVAWKRGRNTQHGVIDAHAYFDQFFVRNSRTGKLVKLYVSDMLEGEAP